METDGEEEETSGEVDWQQEGIGGDRSGVAAQLGGLMDVGENVRGERAGSVAYTQLTLPTNKAV